MVQNWALQTSTPRTGLICSSCCLRALRLARGVSFHTRPGPGNESFIYAHFPTFYSVCPQSTNIYIYIIYIIYIYYRLYYITIYSIYIYILCIVALGRCCWKWTWRLPGCLCSRLLCVMLDRSWAISSEILMQELEKSNQWAEDWIRRKSMQEGGDQETKFLRGALPSGWHMSEYLAATFSACPKELNELDGRHLLRRTGCSAEPLQNPWTTVTADAAGSYGTVA